MKSTSLGAWRYPQSKDSQQGVRAAMEFSCQKCYVVFQAARYNRDPYCPDCMESSYEGAHWRDSLSAEQNALINNIIDPAVAHLSKNDIRRALRDAQGNMCAICGATELPLFVDHDHTSGLVRGLLCHYCNIGLGGFKDDPARLQSAIRYLAKNYSHRARVLYSFHPTQRYYRHRRKPRSF